jgi:DNA-binding NtrC family response regulator
MQAVRAKIARFAPFDWHVLVAGASGTGKNVVARELHRLSPQRCRGPFVECQINSLADGIAAGELEGHRRGAFTGAVTDRAGPFESAHGGTLFIDEVGTASAATQALLLRLVEGSVKRLGEVRTRDIDVRMVFATNENLGTMVKAGAFRGDLYARMRVLPLSMPALSEHREDIPELANHLLKRFAEEAHVDCPRLPRAVMDRMIAYDWPWNVRELENALKLYIVEGVLPEFVRRPGRKPSEWQDQLPEALERNGGDVSATARDFIVSRKAVYRALKKAAGVDL